VSDANAVFAELEDPDGRIVFFDRPGGAVRTASGFLIADREQD
jgi:hypothetical protein